MNRTFQSMYAVKLANRQAGFHFFEKATLRFFASRIGRELYGGKYFITSEQFIPSSGLAEPRKYTVRCIHPEGDITTIGAFQQYGSATTARNQIKRLLATEDSSQQ